MEGWPPLKHDDAMPNRHESHSQPIQPKSLWRYVTESVKIFPLNKVVVGIVGVGAGAVLVLTFFLGNVRLAVGSLVGMMILIPIMLILSWANKHGGKDARPLIIFLLWFFAIAFAAIVVLLISATFFGVPQVGAKRFFG